MRLPRTLLRLEGMERRDLCSVGFDLGGGLLFVHGDDQGNVLLLHADQGGRLHVTERGAEVPVYGLVPTVQNTALVALESGRGGANILAVDASVGQLSVVLDARRGGDTLFAEAPGSVALEVPGDGPVFRLPLPAGVPAVPVNLQDEGPNSLAVDALAQSQGVTGMAPRTRLQEAADAVVWVQMYESFLDPNEGFATV